MSKKIYSSLKGSAFALTVAALCATNSIAQVTYTFSNCGATGVSGPSQSLVNSAYASTNLSGSVIVTGGIQSFTVPTSGVYTFSAYGAAGGNSSSGAYIGGKGAFVSGQFNLTAGTVLKILVGQMGSNGIYGGNYPGGGGGGGSYIVTGSTLLMAAGGGGGAGTGETNANGNNGNPGVITTTGNVANGTNAYSNGVPGTNGSGGTGGNWYAGAGGGGYSSSGSNSSGGSISSGGLSYGSGGTGGAGGSLSGTGGAGGFGGGGGSMFGGGGGGGYSGGAGGTHGGSSNASAGGGGGSYNAGTSTVAIANVNSGQGYVLISSGIGSGPITGSAQTSTTFSYTGAMSTFTVPSCVYVVTITAYGAQGKGAGPYYSTSGGLGGVASGVMSVTPGQVLNVFVGGQTTGFNGGGAGQTGANGGGASDVRSGGTALTDRVIVAGGGGGAGGDNWGCNTGGGKGGGGTAVGSNFVGGGGGSGYNGCGVAGGNSGGAGYCCSTHGGGGGGGLTSGGGGAYGGLGTAGSGSLGLGGAAYVASSCSSNGTGGGGGGYYGGGGASGYNCGAGMGGGGSSWTGTLSSPGFTAGTRSGDGLVVFSYAITSGVTVSATPSVICQGSSTSVTLTASGASSYTWNTGSNASSIVVTPTAAASYTAMGTNSLGCIGGYYVGIPINPLPTITVNSGTMCASGVFTIIPSGAATYTYAGGSNTVSPSVNNIYTVTGTSSSGCEAASPAISSVTVIPVSSITVNSGTVCSGSGFTLVPSGATNYTYSGGSNIVYPTSSVAYSVSGTGTNGCPTFPAVSNVTVIPLPTVSVNSGTVCSGKVYTIIPSGAATYTVSSLGSGTSFTVSPSTSVNYLINGTSSLGCISSNNALCALTVFSSPTITASSGSICTGNVYTISTSGASSYTFSGGSSTVNPLTTTSYSVTGSNTAGCVSNTVVSTVTVYVTPTVGVSSGQVCSGQIFTMVPSGASTYTFSNGSATVSPVSNSSYSVTGTSAQGCISSNTAVSSIVVNPNPTITVPNGTICAGASFTMNPSGAFAYNYSSGSQVVSPTTNTVYQVGGVSSQGCVSTNSAVCTVSVISAPNLSVNSGGVCPGGSFTIVPTGSSTYTFMNGGPVVSPSVTSTYSVISTNASGCSSVAISSVSIYTNPTISVNSGGVCPGKVFTITPTGAATYTYSNGSNTVSPTTNSSYTVTGSSAQGCAAVNTVVCSVTISPIPTITVNGGAVCNGVPFVMTPSGAVTYTFSGGSATVNPTSNTSYTVTGTNSDGCTNTVGAVCNVTVASNPVISIPSGTVCLGSSYTLTPSGAATYTYSSGTAVITPSVTGSYSITGTSSVGCPGSNTAVCSVSVIPIPVISVSSGTICSGQSYTIVSNGAVTYTYSSGGAIVSPTTNTNYSVTGTSSLGCNSVPAISSVTVLASPQLTVNSTSNVLCLGESATLTASGASSYTWNASIISPSISVTPTMIATYSLAGTNGATGCSTYTYYTQSVDPCTGILSQDGKSAINVYPNPNSGLFEINIAHADLSGMKVEVFTTLGQRVLSITPESEKTSVDMRLYDNGIYFVQLSKGSKILAHTRIIKN